MTVRMIGRNRARGVAGIGDDGKLLASIIPAGANGFLLLDAQGKIAIATVASDGNDPNGIVLLDAAGKVLASLIPQGANGFLVLDAAGKIAVATVASDGNDPNGIVLLDASAKIAEDLLYNYYVIRVGAAFHWYGASGAFPPGISVPTNCLKCDGSAVSKTTYATLYAVLGDSHWRYIYNTDIGGINQFEIIGDEVTNANNAIPNGGFTIAKGTGLKIRTTVTTNPAGQMNAGATVYSGTPWVDEFGVRWYVRLYVNVADANADNGNYITPSVANQGTYVCLPTQFHVPSETGAYVRYQ